MLPFSWFLSDSSPLTSHDSGKVGSQEETRGQNKHRVQQQCARAVVCMRSADASTVPLQGEGDAALLGAEG